MLIAASDLLSAWHALPDQTRFIATSAVLTLAVKGLRKIAPKIDGRWVHVVTGGLALVGAGAGALTQAGAQSPYLPVISQAVASAVAAIGVNEIAKKAAPAPSSSDGA